MYQAYGGTSDYHSFQAFLTKRFSNNYSFQMAYTYSKSLADASLTCCGGGTGSQLTDPSNPNYDRGYSNYDRPNILTINSIYRVPTLANKSWLEREVLGGWESTGIYSYSSGVPFVPHLSANLIGVNGNSQTRPDLIVSGAPGPHTANQWFSQSDFAIPLQLGRLGFSPHGVGRLPPLNQLDFAIYKNFNLKWESSYIQLRFETFNTLNHTQLYGVDNNYAVSGLSIQMPGTGGTGQPAAQYSATNFTSCRNSGTDANGNPIPVPIGNGTGCLSNGNFGKATLARDPREIQIALKFVF